MYIQLEGAVPPLATVVEGIQEGIIENRAYANGVVALVLHQKDLPRRGCVPAKIARYEPRKRRA